MVIVIDVVLNCIKTMTLQETLKAFREEVCPLCKEDKEHQIKDCHLETHLVNPHWVMSFFSESIKSACEEMIVEEIKVSTTEMTGDESLSLLGKHPVLRNSDIARSGYGLARQDQLERLKRILG